MKSASLFENLTVSTVQLLFGGQIKYSWSGKGLPTFC